jgi:high-affinity iron transporter
MISIFLTTFREGLEAFLIISVATAFLRKTNNRMLLTPLFIGSVCAIVLSSILGVYLAHTGGLSPVLEAWLALVAALLVITCVVPLVIRGKKVAIEIRQKMIDITDKSSKKMVWLGVFLFAVFMVGREALEAVMLIAALASSSQTLIIVNSAAIGVVFAGIVAVLWSIYGAAVYIGLLLRITGIFLVLFALQLLVYAFHEFSEAGVLPWLDNLYWHDLTEAYSPNGKYGAWLTYSLLLIPVGLVVGSFLLRRINLPRNNLEVK